MRKSTKIVKRIMALFLVVLMSIESFAAVVSDNDGSAFITKAEFDSLKNNFQSQIDQYNVSIDSKIDGAIASYLAGINVAKKTLVTLNGEVNDVTMGQGYRSYDSSYLSARIGDMTEWVINSLTITPRAGRWENLNDGIVSIARTSQDTTADNEAKFSPDPWILGNGGTEWSNSSTSWSSNYMAALIVTQHTGVLSPVIGNNKPLIFCNANGTITGYDNRRLIISDSRFYKGSDYPSSFRRGIILYGSSADSYPTYANYLINQQLSLPAQGGPLKAGSSTITYFNGHSGQCRALVKSATIKYNKNIFCYNLGTSTLVDAFDDNVTNFYVNAKVKTTALTEDNTNIQSECILQNAVFRQNANGTSDSGQMFFVSRPEFHFNQLYSNTNLQSGCFADDSNDSIKRLKMQYLSNQDFKSGDKTRNILIYEGLPIYTAEKEGKLEFKLKVKTNHDASALHVVDPGTSTSKIKLRIKSSEFYIGNDTTNAVEMKVGTATSPISPTTPKVTEASIDQGTETTSEIECDAKKTYFLRWYVDGYDYGGEITYLRDGYFTQGS